MRGVKILAESSEPPGPALSLLAAHVLECLLHSYLARDGDDRAARDQHIRHNLEELWAKAVGESLRISAKSSAWAATLSALHKRPFTLRYSKRLNAFSTPPPEPMVSELQDLVESVRDQLRG